MGSTTLSDLHKSICVIGSGPAGLISAHVLLKDGFTNVEVLTHDHSAGGTWAEERVPPELKVNNVHGEYNFSALPMPPPAQGKQSGGRLSGEDVRLYMESFAERFLKGRIHYGTDVTSIRREKVDSSDVSTKEWAVSMRARGTGEESRRTYDKIVLCTGGCSHPAYPTNLSPADAARVGFQGPFFHSSYIKSHLEELLSAVKPLSDSEPGRVVVIGGGKSAQDAATYLANHGRMVSLVFETADAAIASAIPLPEFVRKSRFLAVLSPSPHLRTRLERFLHTTWLGSKLTHAIWSALRESTFAALGVSHDSPLRHTHNLFWSLRINDEGVPTPDRFFSLVKAGKIELTAPARVQRFGDDGKSVILEDGRTVAADAVILCSGFTSSWKDILSKETYKELGLDVHPPPPEDAQYRQEFKYRTLENPQGTGALFRAAKPDADHAAAIYRGLVPARNILNRDFAINGAIFTTNNGYVFEVGAHWIASYFRGDPFLRLPKTIEAAIEDAERNNSWLRQRYPGMRGWASESYSADMAMFGWPQLADTLIEDMGLPIMRSRGNWLTWPFKVIDLKEIKYLKEERDDRRKRAAASNS
ncbi:hypothetical protein PHLGIDRAFT_452381 [Phlebiopsis gigantea 11061_1 CR5-6]|uniref:FAD/NAD(P)-binding domain-containing protein n=1 Tax=Phlebiopsis gigantea (strain 11061_1 CR5-6) TaxID=745531 RepID=A0A0C3S9X1_PHLG1|nr:hypothetical protein PHLGIDRAFT_452381 [Phlebiopsis gigantea 11061_1 CR5-6]